MTRGLLFGICPSLQTRQIRNQSTPKFGLESSPGSGPSVSGALGASARETMALLVLTLPQNRLYTPVIYIGKAKTYSYLRIHLENQKSLPSRYQISLKLLSNLIQHRSIVDDDKTAITTTNLNLFHIYIYIQNFFYPKINVVVVVLSSLRFKS